MATIEPLLIEEHDDYATYWYCDVPDERTPYRVLREVWRGLGKPRPVREIHEIRINGGK